MQKKLIALAVAAVAGSAFAQTNVTLYGIADVGVLNQHSQAAGSKNQTSINSGVLSTSRLGFKGTEDLGNGLKALFTLEYGLTMDNSTTIGAGTSGGTQARQQFVGLTGGFGTVIAGRLQTTGLDFTVDGTALGASASLGATNVVGGSTVKGGGTLITGVLDTARANNAIAYVSPSFSGLTLAVNHARVTETALTTGIADTVANLVSASYANGPITAGAIYTRLSPAGSNNDTKEWGIRGGYNFGVAKVQATYQQQKAEATSAKDKKYVLSVTVPVTAALAVVGEYANYNPQGDNNTSKAYTLASTYALSKRTTAYAGFVYSNPTGDNNNVRTLGLGLRHAF